MQAWELKDENNYGSSYIRIYRLRMEVRKASDLMAPREVMADFPDSLTKRIRLVMLLHVVRCVFVGLACVCSDHVWLHMAKDSHMCYSVFHTL